MTTNQLHTPLCEILGIEYPVLLAGMGVGGPEATSPTPAALVAAVTNAGGLGVMGGDFDSVESMDAGVRELKRLTNGRPFGLDLLLPVARAEVTARTGREAYAEAASRYPEYVALVDQLLEKHALVRAEVPDVEPISTELIRKKLEVILDNHVPLFAAGAGEPPEWFVERGRAQGMKFIGMCGRVRHAERQVAAGADILVAQGTEAGGHTGDISTFVLVPQVVDAVSPRPVLAAGGIGSGRQVAAALALGAQGVWVGTAFLAAEETNIPRAHQDQILTGASEQFTLGKFSSGKQQRAYKNVVKEAWESSSLEPLPFPLQRLIQEPFLRAARDAGRWDLVTNPSGQVGGMLTERRPARDILMSLVTDAANTIDELQSLAP